MQTLFEKLGGAGAVDVAVDRFYDKVLADQRIGHFFAHTDMARQRAHQKAFLTVAFGGPNAYEGRDMRAGHARLVKERGLSDPHFDAVAENLASTQRKMGVADVLIGDVATVAESVRNEVLGR